MTSSDANCSRVHSSATLYKASLGLAAYGTVGTSSAELFYNGEPMQLGRWPNGTGLAALTGERHHL